MIFNAWKDWRRPQLSYNQPLYTLLIPIIILLALGLLIQFILSPALSSRLGSGTASNYFFVRHFVSVFVGLGALFLGFKLNLKYWLNWSTWIFVGGLILSILAIIIGGAGDVRWLQIGPLSLQPVEILKIGFILLAAGYFSQVYNSQYKSWREIFKFNRMPLILIIILGLVVLVLQRDYGSMFVLGMIFLAMFWVSGLMTRFLWVVVGLMAVAGIFFIIIAPYRIQRLSVFFNPSADCQDSGYQICQSLIGVGSGGFTGRGLNSSVQIYGYLPEANNDTVFVSYAELAGFLGAVIMLSCLSYLLVMLYRIASRLEDSLMLIVVGCTAWIAVQSIVNLGGVLNIIPLKGITLPLISSGGSSLVFILLILGIVLQISGYIIYKDERQSHQSSTSRRRYRRTRNTSRRSRRRY